MRTITTLLLILLLGANLSGCRRERQRLMTLPADAVYSNPLKAYGSDPWAIYYKGYYYYTEGTDREVRLWKTADISRLDSAESKVVYIPTEGEGRYHLWAPELHRIGGKWYLYYEADDGNTDNHQIYVAENGQDDPMDGTFRLKARLVTDARRNWAIHASTFFLHGKQYLLWSGWQQKRTDAETQCIYIAGMENPWTLSSDRILISKPEYVWECQWVSPDGNMSAYPIYVNENPEAFVTSRKVYVYYNASGLWTPYSCIGRLEAAVESDLLDPASWRKSEEPVFVQNPADSVFSLGGISFIPSPHGDAWYILYHARSRPNDAPGEADSRCPRLQKITFTETGEPVLGKPLKMDTLLVRPGVEIP